MFQIVLVKCLFNWPNTVTVVSYRRQIVSTVTISNITIQLCSIRINRIALRCSEMHNMHVQILVKIVKYIKKTIILNIPPVGLYMK